MFPCIFFKLSDGSLENNTLLVASLDLALQGSLILLLEVFLTCCALAHPSGLLWGALPLWPSSCCYGVLEKSLLWCRFTVTALCLPPFRVAATLANPSTFENPHQHRGAWAPGPSSRPQQLPLCAFPFLCPNFQRACGRG